MRSAMCIYPQHHTQINIFNLVKNDMFKDYINPNLLIIKINCLNTFYYAKIEFIFETDNQNDNRALCFTFFLSNLKVNKLDYNQKFKHFKRLKAGTCQSKAAKYVFCKVF